MTHPCSIQHSITRSDYSLIPSISISTPSTTFYSMACATAFFLWNRSLRWRQRSKQKWHGCSTNLGCDGMGFLIERTYICGGFDGTQHFHLLPEDVAKEKGGNYDDIDFQDKSSNEEEPN